MPETIVPGDATLNLNVFSPARGRFLNPAPAETGLPVMVWFHGGGYIAGSPKNEWYEAPSFTRDGVIVVTVSYRLGFDGFGLIEGAPTNRAVRDWLAALTWVRDNIAAFGGDPGRVTIAGQSAGGGVVLTLLGMERAEGLFRAAISLSGVIEDVSPERARREADRLARLAGVAADRAGFASLDEDRLRDLQPGGPGTPVLDRIRAVKAMMGGQLPVGPLIDGDLIERPTRDSLAQGVNAAKPLLICTLDQEMTTEWGRWMPKPLALVPKTALLKRIGLDQAAARIYAAEHREMTTRQLIGQVGGDLVFRRPALAVAELRGANTWLARMPWRSGSFGDSRHCVDVPFFFDILDWPSAQVWTGPDAPPEIADALHGAALALIRGENPAWEAWTAERGATLVLDAPVRVERNGYGDVRCLKADSRMGKSWT
jgi:para-nitrobenzyl esterase